ncbi:hypothetical protein [Amphiplicatus metriothermophilus]|uniref:Ribosome-binding factor A n=1 Tax=Amphiplicatus metriothermophilus TaxID=1519374 RepID=A0A239PIF6_9PROT|nr:hypothetical protein [Amphiplicatus metriothermophilus]MBB5518074.1 hypothetical protein [Amphiplicatus metriothermophilus]SNT67592.1 hypothetical protein SAMN06297382_0082 [Amphiplicatus metriothermophilus]
MQGKIRDIVEQVVKDRFPDARILSVSVNEDEDFEGERILRVTVVFDSATGLLDSQRAASLVRHMRPKLREAGEEAFPILSFISKADAELASAGA